MEYIFNFKGQTVELPKYSIAISDKIEKITNTNSRTVSVKDKLKNLYNLFTDIIGKDKTKDILGEFNDSDPNEINIFYLEIIKCYNSPFDNYNTESTLEQLDGIGLDKLREALELIQKSNTIIPNKG